MARERAGLTQDEVARKLKLHASFLSKCEWGERRVDVVELAALCKAYQVPLADFLKEAGLLNAAAHASLSAPLISSL